MKPGCTPFEHELSAYVDGELDAAERARVESHLHGCARCTAEIRELRRVGDTLRRWDAHETRYATSTGFRNRVFSRLGSGAHVASDDVRTWRRAAWVAATAAGVVAAFTWASSHSAPQATDLAAVESRVRAMEAELAAIQASRRAGHTDDRTARPPIAIERLGDLPPVVGPAASTVAEVAIDEPDDPWEVRGEGTLHRDAVSGYEEFLKEQRWLSLEEKFFARVDHKDGGATSAALAVLPPLASFLGRVTLPSTSYPPFERVQVWPIERTSSMKVVPPMLLGKAIEERALAVAEERDTDTVIAENKDLQQRSVLLLAGDVIKGGRRDRVLREDLLVPPGRRISLPVFGAGAVDEKSRYVRFTRSLLVAPFDLRGLVAASYVGTDVRQRDVDQTVAATLRSLGSSGSPGSLENLSTNPVLSQEVARYTSAFRARLDGKNVVGFAFAVGSRIVGADVCGDPETFRVLRDRLLGSHVLYALSGDAVQGPPPADAAVQAVLTAASRAVYSEPAATGDATMSVFRERDGQVFGYGLLDGSHVIHATVFAGMPAGPAADAASKGRGPFRKDPATPAPGGRDPGSTPGKSGGGDAPAGGLDK